MKLLPAGQAMARMYDEIEAGHVPGVSDISALFKDGIHPNDLGYYFVTMVQFAAIYGRSPEGLPTRLADKWGRRFETPPAPLAAAMQRIAWETVRDFREGGGS